jgi:hypothetical protein
LYHRFNGSSYNLTFIKKFWKYQTLPEEYFQKQLNNENLSLAAVPFVPRRLMLGIELAGYTNYYFVVIVIVVVVVVVGQ